MKTMTVRGSPIFRNLLVTAAVVIVVFGLKYSSEMLAPIFFAATLAIVIILNAAMDNAVTPRIMGKGLNLLILLVFLSFLFWSWVFGFIGALLAIPATLFVKTLLQGRQETRFLVVLLSGQSNSDTTVTIPENRRDENNTVEEQSDSPDASHRTLIVDSRDPADHEE